MLNDTVHLSDEDLLRVLDGELSQGRAKQVRAHLAACSMCQARLRELEATIGELVSLRETWEPQLPPEAGARSVFKSRLAEEAELAPPSRWLWFLDNVPPVWAAVSVCLLACISLVLVRHFQPQRMIAAIPDHNLTPGATRPVSLSEVCSMAHEEVVSDVPTFLRQQVFREYGITNPRSEDYEVDYLIAPGLGGAEDIHNLWPEPATTSSTWNAHVKDALEERLHQLVCAGKLDLATAQSAIARDWIAAYKTYLGAQNTGSQGPQVEGDANSSLALPAILDRSPRYAGFPRRPRVEIQGTLRLVAERD
jgi:Putative zinc-finger